MKEARIPKNTVEFDTHEYEFSHGHKPRGFGAWAFVFVGHSRDIVWAPAPLTFTDACKWARERAASLGCHLVRICS